MRHFFILALTFLPLSFALGQSDTTTFEDIENASQLIGLSELEEELEFSDFDSIDDLDSLTRASQSTRPPRVLDKPRLKTKWTPQTFRAILQKGSLLIRLKDSKEFIVNRRLFVVAQEKVARGNISFLLSKGKEAKYQTATKNLISIENDLKMHPQTDPRQTYKEPTQFHSTDKEFKLENDITMHLESVNVDYFTLFYGGDGGGASATSFALRSFYRSKFPFNFGLSLGFQSGEWLGSQNFETVSWDAFYFGPYLKYDLYQGEKLRLNGQFGIEKSFGLETVSESGDAFSFKSLFWRAEIKALYDTILGTFSVGLEYKKQKATLVDSNVENFLFFPDKGSLTATGLVLGYHIDFNL